MANDRIRCVDYRVFVAHTIEEEGDYEVVRIISARRATPRERTRYEQSRAKYIG